MYPVPVLMGKAHVMDVIFKYEIAGTYSAFPVAFAAALATLDVLEEEDISERSQRLGELLTKTIDELAPPYVLDHRGRGRGLFQTLVLDGCHYPKSWRAFGPTRCVYRNRCE